MSNSTMVSAPQKDQETQRMEPQRKSKFSQAENLFPQSRCSILRIIDSFIKFMDTFYLFIYFDRNKSKKADKEKRNLAKSHPVPPEELKKRNQAKQARRSLT